MEKLNIKYIVKSFLLVTFIFFPLFSNLLFFLVLGLVGYNYEGRENSSAYIIYTALILIWSVVGYTFCLFSQKLKKSELLLWIYYILFLCVAIVFSLFSTYDFNEKELVLFLLFSIPGIISALLYSRYFNTLLYPFFLLFCLMMSYTLIAGFLKVFFSAQLFSEVLLGGASYQFISYTASVLFGFSLLAFYYTRKYGSCKFYRFLFYLNYPLLVVLPLIVIATGSKGAFLLLVIYFLTYSFFVILNRPLSFILYSSATILILVLSFNFLINDFTGLTSVGFDRISVLFDPDASVENKTTGRTEYYINFIELIKTSPITGYGTFIGNGYVTNSHNFFSMVILNFGIFIAFIIFTLILYVFVSIFMRSSKYDVYMTIPIVIMLFAVTNLMFSGSYLKNPFFWFSLFFSALQIISRSNKSKNGRF